MSDTDYIRAEIDALRTEVWDSIRSLQSGLTQLEKLVAIHKHTEEMTRIIELEKQFKGFEFVVGANDPDRKGVTGELDELYQRIGMLGTLLEKHRKEIATLWFVNHVHEHKDPYFAMPDEED